MLSRLAGVEDQRRRRLRRPAVSHQRRDARLPPTGRQTQHNSLGAFDQPEGDRSRPAFDRQRDAAHHRRSQLDDEPGDRFEVDLSALELRGNVAAIREGVRVAWKEDGHLATCACETHYLLGRLERPDIRVRGSKVKKRSAATITAADDFGILDRLDRLNGGQARMSGTDADQPDSAHESTNARSTKTG